MKNNYAPFLKWAGGKRWFVNKHHELFPQFTGTYYEPFLGSGAVFFYLKPTNAIISDINEELVTTYVALRDDYKKVYGKLRKHHSNHNKDYYYEQRATQPKAPSSIAARFIYLNRTCFNGLYRVNLKGEFNVPKGTKSNVIYEYDDFQKIADNLSEAQIYRQDFEQTLAAARQGDFAYIDPPYTVNHNQNGFLKYNEQIFSWIDQERLSNVALAAANRGALVMISNANHESIHALYHGKPWRIHIVERPSILSATSKHRRMTTELIVTNF